MNLASLATMPAQYPDTSIAASATATCAREPQSEVSELLQNSFEDELEFHIEDSQWLYLTAYERFQLYGLPHDRDEALLHLHRMNLAILARSPAVQAARHAEFERLVCEQVSYFTSDHAMELGRAA